MYGGGIVCVCAANANKTMEHNKSSEKLDRCAASLENSIRFIMVFTFKSYGNFRVGENTKRNKIEQIPIS